MKHLRSAICLSFLMLFAGAAVFAGGAATARGFGFSPNATATATQCPTPVATSTCSVPVGTPTVSAINFYPENPTINNPATPGTTARPQTVTLQLFAYDTNGHLIKPTSQNPFQIAIFGAPEGAISTSTASITSSLFSFKYKGQYLPNDLMLEAWIKNPKPSQTLGVYSIGNMLILRRNRQSPDNCSYQPTSLGMGTDCSEGTVPGDCANMTAGSGIQISAAIGKVPAGSPTSSFHKYTVDTGSLGLLVPQSQVPAVYLTPGDRQVVGPGGPGIRFYDSNGGTCYQGQYWFAPVSFGLSSSGGTMTSIATTHPVKILVVPDNHPLNYLGVGFDRNGTTTGDYFNSPADNAFLNLTDAANGSDISPGYTITPTQITLGVTSSAGFDTAPLQPNQCVAGDYVTAPGCVSFPALSPQGSFCGTVLMDTGIGDMYINIGSDSWPDGYCESGLVPDATTVQINSGTSTSSATCYRYSVDNSVPSPAPTPIGPAPSITNCIKNNQNQSIMFVNTGRHPLSWFSYLYDAACGQVGFMPNAQYQQTCP